MAAKILNYRFQSFDCHAILAVIHLIVTLLLLRRCSRYAIRSSRFRLVRVNELHENWATSFRDFVAFFFLMTTHCCNYCSVPFLSHYHLPELLTSVFLHFRIHHHEKKKKPVLSRTFVLIHPFLICDFTYTIISLITDQLKRNHATYYTN